MFANTWSHQYYFTNILLLWFWSFNILLCIGFKGFEKEKKKTTLINEDHDSDDDEEEIEQGSLEKAYDYLLSMKIWSLTMEKVQSLQRQAGEKKEELDTLNAKTARDLWLEDLEELELALDHYEADIEEAKQSEGPWCAHHTILIIIPRNCH